MAFWKWLNKEPKFTQKEIEILIASLKEHSDERWHEYIDRMYFAWLIVRT